MDLYDSEVGRRIAAEAAEDPSINVEERVKRAVDDGEVLVIDGDGRLAFSDEVAPGETGEAHPRQEAARTAARAARRGV